MSKARIQEKRDTTENWGNAIGFIPLKGEIIIYTDYEKVTREIDGQMVEVDEPAIKVGDGKTYVQDLPFVGDKIKQIVLDHINNQELHVSNLDRSFWSNKLNVDDEFEVDDFALIFNRN